MPARRTTTRSPDRRHAPRAGAAPPSASSLTRRLHEAESLVTILTEIGAASDVRAICKVACERVAALVRGSGATIMLESRGGTELRTVAVAGKTTLEVMRQFETPGTAIYRTLRETGAVFVERDLRRNPKSRPQATAIESAGFVAIACVPLGPPGRIRGVLGIGTERKDDLDDEAVRVLTQAGRALGSAIEKAELLESVRRELAQTELVRDVSGEIVGTLDLQPLLDRVARGLKRLVDATECFILLHHPASRELRGVAGTEPLDGVRGGIQIPDRGTRSASVEAWRTRAPIVVDDCPRDPRVNQRLIRRFKTRSLLAVPLVSGERAIGVVILLESRYRRDFRADEVARVQTVGNQAALAIDNARRHEDAVRLRARAELLIEVVRASTASRDVRAGLRDMAARLVARAGVARCVIALLDDTGERIVDVIIAGGTPELRAMGDRLRGKKLSTYKLGRRLQEARRGLAVLRPVRERLIPEHIARAFGTRSILLVPVRSPRRSSRRLVAALALGYAESAPEPGDEDVRVADGIARQMALSVVNGRAFAEIERQQRTLDELTGRIIGAQEDERRRIARELHDGVSQQLTGAKLLLERFTRHSKGTCSEAEIAEVVRATGTLTESIRELRRLCVNLRPLQLDHLGFGATIGWYVKSFAERTGLDVRARVGARLPPLSPELEINLYRIVQEALSNVEQHAGAGRVDVRVVARRRAIEVSVRDDGRGFDQERLAGRRIDERGTGLLTMGERAHLLGGELSVRSAAGEGTSIDVVVPLARAAKAEVRR